MAEERPSGDEVNAMYARSGISTRPVAVADREVGDLVVMSTMLGLPVSGEMCVRLPGTGVFLSISS